MIIKIPELHKLWDRLGKVVCASGGFDPLHPGHVSYLKEAKKLGDTLVVFVNGDPFLERKKGKAFMPLQDRCIIVDSLKCVDYTIPFINYIDQTVNQALLLLKPHVFANGGDRDIKDIPEVLTCDTLGIEVVTRVGMSKKWSSSNYLQDWLDHFTDE